MAITYIVPANTNAVAYTQDEGSLVEFRTKAERSFDAPLSVEDDVLWFPSQEDGLQVGIKSQLVKRVVTRDAVKGDRCGYCNATGRYAGKGTGGICFRCRGKGVQTPEDIRRCEAYDDWLAASAIRSDTKKPAGDVSKKVAVALDDAYEQHKHLLEEAMVGE